MSLVQNPAIVYISPAELVVHPKLIEIYGENEDRPALEKSISEKGILESLKVSARTDVNVVLAGKCRLQIARQLGISAVKVEFVESGSPEEDLKLVLDFNLHREGGKTHYQKFHEGQYWESVLRPQAKERQRESARRLNQSNDSNLNHSLNETNYQLNKGKRVIQEVSENLSISVGSYHKGKKVFEYISQLRELEKFKAVVALEVEFNRSIDAAYKFNYKAIRCPMQPGSGSFLLNDDLQAISDSVSIFLDHCDRAANRQDLTKLKRVANKAKKQITRERYRKQESADVAQWRANWEEIITTGWTGKGQTNTLLQIFVGYGIVFLDLESDKLVEFCLTTAINAPGYSQYCRHQHEIEARVQHWVESTIRNKWYSAYISYPERLLGTFANTFAEAIAGISKIDKPKDNVIPFDRRKQQNWERSQQAQQRIQIVVRAIEWDSGLPTGATERGKAIRAEYKRRFHKTISQETLQKHLHLWHPTRYILDPWAENSSTPYQSSNDGQFDSFQNSFAKPIAENPYQMENYGHFYYMKVFCYCLPSAADALTGQQAVASFEEVAPSEGELFVLQVQDEFEVQVQNESEEINFNSEELNLLQPEDLSLTSGVNNSDNLLVSLNIIQLGQNVNQTNSDKDFKYLSNPSASENYNNKNLLINSVSIPPTAPTAAIVPPETLQKAEVKEQSTPLSDPAATLALSELKKLTKLRLQAVSHAKRVAREYCLIARYLIGGKERERLEQTAKMQFYLDSSNETLIAEANEWAAANPGCLPFSLELAFQEGET